MYDGNENSVFTHDFQHITKNCQTQSSLSSVENHAEEFKNYYDGNGNVRSMWNNILHAVNNLWSKLIWKTLYENEKQLFTCAGGALFSVLSLSFEFCVFFLFILMCFAHQNNLFNSVENLESLVMEGTYRERVHCHCW